MPEIDGHKCTVWQIFQRDLVHVPARTSVSVLCDNRPGKLRLGYSNRVKCLMCPGVASNRNVCSHEVTWVELLNSKYRAHLSTEEYFTQNNIEPEEEIIERTRDCPNVSRMPRRFFPCTKEEEVLPNVLGSISNSRRKSDQSQVTRFVGVDENVYCTPCNFSFASKIHSESGNIRYRCPTLHTLHHGPVLITVTDVVCRSCGVIIPHDGESDSLFSSSETSVYTREILDSWVYDIWAKGYNFRDVFDSWYERSHSAYSNTHRIGFEKVIGRRQVNDAFTQFLKTLRFPSSDVLNSIFSCDKCEEQTATGERRLDALVMDGIATRILGNLPEFRRWTETVPGISHSIAGKQYLMQTPKNRSFC